LITDKGRNILAKYLIGQAPAYASYLALGVGRRPLSPTDPEEDYSLQQELEFEVLRVPISSRGYVYDELGKANIVFVGELPSEQRYEFTEIGVFSAKSNTIAGSLGSRMIYTFSESENWEYHDQNAAVGISTFLEPLYLDEEQNVIAVTNPVFRTSSNNALFAGSDVRIDTQQRPRFLDKALLIRGDMSTLVTGENGLELEPNSETEYNSTHIHLSGATPNLNRNPPQDELRLAFSVVSKLDTQLAEIDSVKILIEFASTDAVSPDNFARLQVDASSEDIDFETNRYFVSKTKLENLVKSSGFTWSNVNVVKVYVSIYEKGPNPGDPSVLSNNFYVALDGLRFENLTSISPLYGLSGYSVVRNEEQRPVVKETNSSNLLEFRFGLDVQ
jgi:hypothetical protein